MSDVTLKGGDLLTQICTSVTLGKNFVSNLMLGSSLYVCKHTKVKITFKCNNTIQNTTKYNNTISQLTKPVNKNTSPPPPVTETEPTR
jgi:hypothetical protein